MSTKETNLSNINKEVQKGIIPVLSNERSYNHLESLLILGGYGIATWCYTQGAYIASMLDFKQLIISSFFGNLVILAIYMLPMTLSAKYGIDIWIYLKSLFGTRGIKAIIALIIVVNFPWFAVNADLFGSSMGQLIGAFGITVNGVGLKVLAISCAVIGGLLAWGGLKAITWTTRILVPLLIIVGVVVIFVAFTATSLTEIVAYKPDISGFENTLDPYIIALEGNFAFAFSWSCSTGALPRQCKSEGAAYWGTVGAYGILAPLFVFAGGVMAISMFIKSGEFVSDPTIMLNTLGGPILALMSLLLVAFANIGTHGVGCYLWSIVLKSAFPKVDYRVFVFGLSTYVAVLCLWGKILEYFGAFISLSAYIYGPIMALLFVDFYFVRKKKLAFRSAFELDGYNVYKYNGGFNLVSIIMVLAGVSAALLIYDPLHGIIKSDLFYYATATGFSFIFTAVLYYAACKIPSIYKYMTPDASEILTQKIR